MAMALEGGRGGGGIAAATAAAATPGSGVVLYAYLKKLKTHRKKFFVLRAETAEASARLEYYDSERKFGSGQAPKRSIPLKNCFNINRKPDSRYKHVIALYTKDDCFSIALDSADDLDRWLKALLKLQHGDEVVDGGEAPKPTFEKSRKRTDKSRTDFQSDPPALDDKEHVWSVTILNRGLGNYGLMGSYSLCLTDKTLSLIRSEREFPQQIELNLTNIRSCGSLKDFFFLEIGRQSTLGAGELWMQTEDSNIAQNVHSTVFHAMSNNRCKTMESENDLVPKSRMRSSSATESSKPKTSKPNHHFPGSSTTSQSAAPKSHHPLFQDVSHNDAQASSSATTTTTTTTTTTISTQHPIVSGVASFYHHLIQLGSSKASERRHSISAGGLSWSGNSNHQRAQSLTLPMATNLAQIPAPIENQSHPPDPSSNNSTSSRVHPPAAAVGTTADSTSSANKRCLNTTNTNQSSKCNPSGVHGRERCDSMPSRARTTSEGNHHHIQIMQNLWNKVPQMMGGYRSSLYNATIASVSPPTDSPPVQSPSAACSTDESAGSSYSLADEVDAGDALLGTATLAPAHPAAGEGRYGHTTPEEAIAEEEIIAEEEAEEPFPECCPPIYDGTPPTSSSYVPMTLHAGGGGGGNVVTVDDGYVDMSPKGRHNSPTVSMSSITSGTPSTDMRFAEYPLEKVTSFFAPASGESDTGSYDERPMRAYSVGSRPEMHRQRKLMEQVRANLPVESSNNSSSNRARAMSVGSKAKKPNRVLPPHHSAHNNNNTTGNGSTTGGSKSSSAPILSGSRLSQGSHNSIGPMDDLMEMDFSRSSSINSGYMDMRPGAGESGSLTNGGQTPPHFGHSGYVEMKIGQQHEIIPEVSPYVDMSASPKLSGGVNCPFGTSPRTTTTNDYVEMDGKKNNNNNNYNNNNYIDMSFNQQARGGRGVAMSPGKSSLNETSEGYVEMSLGGGAGGGHAHHHHHQRNLSWDGDEQKKRTRGDKMRSQPIAIKSPPGEASRKYSAVVTPPTSAMHLPLTSGSSPYSSLPRQQRSRKNSRRDSSSSSSVTTPSSSSTIFPISLNSPASPIKPEIKVPASVLHTVYKKTDDYTPMDFCGGGAIRKQRTTSSDSGATTDDDYVNYDPAPGKENRRSNYYDPLHPWLMDVGSRMDDNNTRFRPITEDSQENQAHPIGRSRPNSASSELCSSSSSTIVGGSRPESVNSRPSSVDQLHYASLDLEDGGNRSPRTIKVSPEGGATAATASTPAQQQQQPIETTATLTYAAIDFVRSEGLRHNSPQPLPNAKVKH